MVLPTATRIASRIPSTSMHCKLCGAPVDSNVDALFECIHAALIRKSSKFYSLMDTNQLVSLWDIF